MILMFYFQDIKYVNFKIKFKIKIMFYCLKELVNNLGMHF